MLHGRRGKKENDVWTRGRVQWRRYSRIQTGFGSQCCMRCCFVVIHLHSMDTCTQSQRQMAHGTWESVEALIDVHRQRTTRHKDSLVLMHARISGSGLQTTIRHADLPHATDSRSLSLPCFDDAAKEFRRCASAAESNLFPEIDTREWNRKLRLV